MVDASKAAKERKRLESKASRDSDRLARARIKLQETDKLKSEKERARLSKKEEAIAAKKQAAINKIAARLEFDFEKNNIHTNAKYLAEIAGKCHELSFTPAGAFKEYVAHKTDEIRFKSIELYLRDIYGSKVVRTESINDAVTSIANAHKDSPQGTALEVVLAKSEAMVSLKKEINDLRKRTEQRNEYLRQIRCNLFTENFREISDIAKAEDMTVKDLQESDLIQAHLKDKKMYLSKLNRKLSKYLEQSPCDCETKP